MISFFRKIRRALIHSGKFTRYVVYSIGEILLVVIGILIALQVNNWNENRKKRLLELELLEELREGLKSDISDLQYNSQAQQEIFNSQNIIIQWLDGNSPYHDSLSQYFARANAGTVFVANEAPYTSLKTEGIRIIQSDTLRKTISRVYDLDFDYYKQHIIMYNNLMMRGWHDANSPYFEATLPRMGSLKNVMQPLDVNKIRRDNEYRYYVKTLRELNYFYLNIIKRAERSASELLDMIDQELRQRIH